MDSPRAQHPQPPPPIPGAQYPPNTAALPYAPSEAHRSQRYDSERRHRLHTHPSQQQQMPPYPGRGRSLTRSPASSRSSSKSLDEMLLETATDPSRSPTFRRPGMVGPGMLPQVQTFNTHTFAPVVTGAPVKKSKGAGLNGSGSVMTLGPNGSVISGPSGVVSGGYPPTNAAGQRICRQCGLPGRYKDGKCVEKWGPGPDGPGTVCDRCRKKMKRVERRNTAADSSQQLPVNAGPPVHHRSLGEHPSVHGSFRSPHMQPAPGSQESDRSIHRTDTLIVRHSPPPPSLGGRHLSPSGSAIQRERERDRDRDEHARPASSYVALQGSVQDRRDFGRSPQPGYSEHRDRRPKDPREIDPAGGRSHSNSLSNSVLSAIPSSTSDSPKEPVASRHSPPSEATQPVDVDADADADAEGEAEL
ncbi:hypothetical protein OE88DRAFT_1233171 [Heliocybe sulcata]|uniref:Uncharacterized protein n=1 Tax=Heliocybe sulcata TaxID=5364 RepID=A0A5C3N796_9AGAM|nr:hypothetical protein OE88DRAFT_1233171 [Heliocybe sulcata]